MNRREGKTSGLGKMMRPLVLGAALLLAAWPALAQAPEHLSDLLAQGIWITQTVAATHEQVCADLARAGLILELVSQDEAGGPVHVFRDPAQARFVTVLGSAPTVVLVSALLPGFDGGLFLE